MVPFESAFLRVLNHLLLPAEWARLRLRPYAGQFVHIQLAPWQLGLLITAEGLFTATEQGGMPAVEISLPSETPFLALQDPSSVMQRARISGNADLAESLGFVFRNLRWNVEEDLAGVVGDVSAYRLVSLGRHLRQLSSRALEALRDNLGEYARDEIGLIIGREALIHQRREVNRIRDDLARLEKRLEWLERP